MATVAFRVPSKELPKNWAEKVGADPDVEVEVTLSTEDRQDLDVDAEIQARGLSLENNPAIGMWADREEMKETSGYLKNLRKPRQLPDAS
jgi:hypothetical protein